MEPTTHPERKHFMKQNKRTRKQLLAISLLSAQAMSMVAPLTSTVVHANTNVAPSTTIQAGQDVAEELVDGKSGLTQVLTVNGNKLTDKVTLNQGDNVTFDIVLTPGNQGLMKQFTDTLPEGLVFNPNSKAAITVHAVNNDGTVGDEITDQGKIVINGGTVTWTPEHPEDYFFAGKTGTRNRLLFHITTKVNSVVAAGSNLVNTAETTFENPKDPNDSPAPVRDEAIVEIPSNPEDPGIRKSVFKEAADGSIDYALPSESNTAQGATDAKKPAPAKLAYEFSSNGKKLITGDEGLFIDQVAKYAASTTEYTEGKVDVTALNAAVDAYKANPTSESLTAIGKALQDVEAKVAEIKGAAPSTTAKAGYTNDNITLNEIAEKYSYVLDVKLPSRAIEKSLVIRDDIEGVQSVDPANVKVYNSKGEDITAKGEVKLETRKSMNVVTWTASEAFVKELNATNTNKSLQVRITGVDVSKADKDELAKHKKGGVISIPNVAKVIADGIEFESNETLVRMPPEDPKNPESTITKGVRAQEGKIDPKTGKTSQTVETNVPVDANGNVQLPEGDNGGVITVTNNDDYATLKANTEKAIKRAKVFNVDTAAVEAELAKLNDKSTADEKTNLIKAFQAMSAKYDEALKAFKAKQAEAASNAAEVKRGDKVTDEIEFDQGQTSLETTSDSYFKYLVNTSINPSEIKDYLQITDPMDGLQSVSVENVRLYSSKGEDITDSFKVEVKEKDGVKVVTARANKDKLKELKAAKSNTKIQLVVYNVQVRSDKAVTVNNVAELELGTGEDGKPITKKSNQTVVNIKGKAADPAKPVDPKDPEKPNPAKPDVKTGSSVAKNPFVIGGVLVALAGGIGAVIFSRKKHDDQA